MLLVIGNSMMNETECCYTNLNNQVFEMKHIIIGEFCLKDFENTFSDGIIRTIFVAQGLFNNKRLNDAAIWL